MFWGCNMTFMQILKKFYSHALMSNLSTVYPYNTISYEIYIFAHFS